MSQLVRIPPVKLMGDETLVNHLELRHGNDLSMEFPESGHVERRLHDSHVWRTYHDKVHELRGESYDHVHNEE